LELTPSPPSFLIILQADELTSNSTTESDRTRARLADSIAAQTQIERRLHEASARLSVVSGAAAAAEARATSAEMGRAKARGLLARSAEVSI